MKISTGTRVLANTGVPPRISAEAVTTFMAIEIHGMQTLIRLQLRESYNRIKNMLRLFYCFAPVFLM